MEQAKKRRKSVYWKPEELAAFYKAARSFGPPERGDSEEIWYKAQELAGLPLDRRRNHDPASAVKMNAERRKGRSDNGQVISAIAPSPVIAPLPIIKPEVKPEILKEEPKAEKPNTETINIVENIISQTATALSDIVLRVLYDPQVRIALRDIVKEMLTPETDLQQAEAITWREPKTPKERLPRIIIAGGLPGVKSTLENFNKADLRFWGQGRHEHRERLKALAKNSDLVVVLTQHISHGAVESLKYINAKYMYWSHSYPDLRVELERIAPTLLIQGDNNA